MLVRQRFIFLLLGSCILTSAFNYPHFFGKTWFVEVVPLKNLPQLHVAAQKVNLVLLDQSTGLAPEKANTYLQCYLINNTDTLFEISNLNKELLGFNSEIKVNGLWKTLQMPLAIRCGNTPDDSQLMTVKPKQAILMRYEQVQTGKYNLPLRLVYTYKNRKLYSNEVVIRVNQLDYMNLLAH